MERWERLTVLAAAAMLSAFLFAGASLGGHGPLASFGGSTPVAFQVADWAGSVVSAPNNTCPTSGPLGGLSTTESALVFVVTGAAGIGVGIAIGRFSGAMRKAGGGNTPDSASPKLSWSGGVGDPMARAGGASSTSGGGSGKVAEPPDPALNPQPLPPGFKPPEPPPGGQPPTET